MYLIKHPLSVYLADIALQGLIYEALVIFYPFSTKSALVLEAPPIKKPLYLTNQAAYQLVLSGTNVNKDTPSTEGFI